MTSDTFVFSSRKSGGSGSSSGGTGSSKPLTSSKGSSGYQDRGGGYRTSVDAGDPTESMISMVEFNPANKEMAVDVPDTFVGRTKTPPRYPPPKPQGSSGYISSSVPYNNNNNNSSSSKGSSKRGTSLSSGTVTPVNGTLSKPVSPPVVPELHQRQDVLVHSPNTQEEVIKLKKYEEEYKQRKEREEEVAELQRNSIRGSQKLQALASYPQGTPQPTHSGVVNQAFDQEHHEDDDRNSSSPSINELIQSLQRIQNVLKSNGHRISEDMTLVAQLLVNPEFQKVLAVHNKVQETWCLNRPPTPVTFKAQELVAECLEALNESSSSEALELVQLLSKYPMEGLFYAHDRIADSEPPLENVGTEHSVDATPEESVERQSNYLEDNVKIVRIDKTNEPLGATIRNEGSCVIIGRIVRGGAAEKSGRLHEGDEILEVNGIEMRGKSVNDVCDMLAGMTGTLTFIIIPCPTLPTVTQPPPVHTIHVKAYFDYDPEEDLYIPCRELGMSFQKGDILHVMNQQDPNWWQAYRDGEEDQSLAGLIPSKSFQQQREAMRQTVVGDSNNKEKSKKGKLLCAKKNQKKKKKKMLYPNYNDVRYQSHLPLSGNGEEIPRIVDETTDGDLGAGRSRVLKIHLPSFHCCKNSSSSSSRHYSRRYSTDDDYDTEEILTYEEVALYFPRSNRKRPIVLIGPPNIGRHELRQKLMEDTEKFAAAVPHTSRVKKDAEVDGQDYHFISRTQFEADILSRKFVEHGEYEKAYYGTSLDAIRAVVNSGKICVLNLHPLSLKMLKNSDLMPYVVLIAPPSLEKLRQKKQKSGETVWEEELKETIQKAREMEDQYGHYFDLVLINQDVERTYQQLIHEINVLEREPQWVPAAWLTSQ
ncbi:MAGUK p55 subfamily member 5-A [Armadillidium vulgare]|nr:MAGUK p55 subfamily member 5-A [Armadillidium vulgare]